MMIMMHRWIQDGRFSIQVWVSGYWDDFWKEKTYEKTTQYSRNCGFPGFRNGKRWGYLVTSCPFGNRLVPIGRSWARSLPKLDPSGSGSKPTLAFRSSWYMVTLWEKTVAWHTLKILHSVVKFPLLVAGPPSFVLLKTMIFLGARLWVYFLLVWLVKSGLIKTDFLVTLR